MHMDERTLSRLAIFFGLVATLAAFASISGGMVPLVITIAAGLVTIGLLLVVLGRAPRGQSSLNDPGPDPRNQ